MAGRSRKIGSRSAEAERGGVERAETLAQDERPRERLLDADLLVEGEADEQRHGVGGDELVSLVGFGEVQAIGHAPIVSAARRLHVGDLDVEGPARNHRHPSGVERSENSVPAPGVVHAASTWPSDSRAGVDPEGLLHGRSRGGDVLTREGAGRARRAGRGLDGRPGSPGHGVVAAHAGEHGHELPAGPPHEHAAEHRVEGGVRDRLHVGERLRRIVRGARDPAVLTEKRPVSGAPSKAVKATSERPAGRRPPARPPGDVMAGAGRGNGAQ